MNAYRTGGTRGGADQFKWEDVKADQYRENYLGHSLMAPTGRWQKGKDLQWYMNKGGDEDAQARAKRELDEQRQADEDAINEALGLAPKRVKTSEQSLDKAELQQLLERGATERDGTDIERVFGLGAAPSKAHEHIPKLSLRERELKRRELEASGGGKVGNEAFVEVVSEKEESRRRRKEKKKAKKKEKKAKKKAKKEAKRERREKEGGSSRRRSRKEEDNSDSSSDESGDGSKSRSRSRSRGARRGGGEGHRKRSRSPSRDRHSRDRHHRSKRSRS